MHKKHRFEIFQQEPKSLNLCGVICQAFGVFKKFPNLANGMQKKIIQHKRVQINLTSNAQVT